ncbi:sensor histidine kinase [Novosphingobium tardum]|uniref:histidine kinase n=1 Tax=Novosphingobium tardum TaxID=1538021 RepID=A0ABV8RQ65_9SPHN
MKASKLPVPSAVIAVLGVTGMLTAGASFWLSAGILLLWLGSLWLARPEPQPERRMSEGVNLTRGTMDSLIEPLGQPLILLDRERITIANAAAREVLGAHIVGQDARIALRHPAAIALLEHGGSGSANVTGLTTPRSIWQVARRPIDERFAMLELINRTAEADISRAHTDFVANASHELSTPLASIIGYIETLIDDSGKVDPATVDRFHATVLREARRLQSLVQDLMSLSRIEAEKHDRPSEQIDLGQLAASVSSEIANVAGDGRLVIEWPREPAIILGDRGQLDQLLRNLIDNALKYGDPAEPVAVTVERQGERVTLTVADKGEGISPDHLPHLTRRFYRTDPGRSRAGGGTGLGLAIVKHIVERHHGRLDIASTPGRGTTVTARFDAGDNSAPQPSAAVS